MKREKPVIVVNSLDMDYCNYFEVQMSIEQFDADFEEKFGEFVEDKICDKYDETGVYEYDGKFGNFEYVLQTDMEEEDEMKTAMNKIRTKIEKYFKKLNVEIIQLPVLLVTDPEDIERSFAGIQELLNENKVKTTEL